MNIKFEVTRIAFRIQMLDRSGKQASKREEAIIFQCSSKFKDRKRKADRGGGSISLQGDEKYERFRRSYVS